MEKLADICSFETLGDSGGQVNMCVHNVASASVTVGDIEKAAVAAGV